MGKRSVVVLSSSDDDCNDDDFSLKAGNLKKSKSTTASVPRTNPRGPKKLRVSSSRSHPGKNVNPFDEVLCFHIVHLIV